MQFTMSAFSPPLVQRSHALSSLMLKVRMGFATTPTHAAVPSFRTSFTCFRFAAPLDVKIIVLRFALRIGGSHANQLRWQANQACLAFATAFSAFHFSLAPRSWNACSSPVPGGFRWSFEVWQHQESSSPSSHRPPEDLLWALRSPAVVANTNEPQPHAWL